MKRRNIVVALCLGVAVASCTQDDGPNDLTPELVQMTISAKEADSEVQTRVGYDSDNGVARFRWNNGDKLSLFSYNSSGNPSNNNCNFATESTTAQGVFKGEANTWTEPQNVYAVYPYNSSSYTISSPADPASATATFTLPNPQMYTVGGSLDNAFMVAATSAAADNVSLHFKQVMSIIKFDISGVASNETVVGVSIDIPNYSFPLAGVVKMADATLSSRSNYTYYQKVGVAGSTEGASLTTVQMALFPVDLSTQNVNIIVYTNLRHYAFTKKGTNFERNERTSVSLNLASASTLEYPQTISKIHSDIGTKGVYINGTGLYWAPVNCGTNEYSKLGQLYQFGRRSGFHYEAPPTASAPTSTPQSGVFYIGSSWWNSDAFFSPFTWTSWNTAYVGNPCPTGWTVPSIVQLRALCQNFVYTPAWYETDTYIAYGHYVAGNSSAWSNPHIFLTKYCIYNSASGQPDMNYSIYWSRDVDPSYANMCYRLLTSEGTIETSSTSPTGAGGFVRCIKETY